MIYTVQKDLELCEKYGITPDQLTYIKCFILDPKHDLKQHRSEVFKNEYRFCKLYNVDILKKTIPKTEAEYNKKKKELAEKIIIPLMDKNILMKINILDASVTTDHIEINPKFAKDFSINIMDMPTELHDVYPALIKNSSMKFPGKNTSPEEFGALYLNYIGNDRELHDKIIDHVKWAKESNNLFTALDKFIKNKLWNMLFELREGGNDGIGFSVEMG